VPAENPLHGGSAGTTRPAFRSSQLPPFPPSSAAFADVAQQQCITADRRPRAPTPATRRNASTGAVLGEVASGVARPLLSDAQAPDQRRSGGL